MMARTIQLLQRRERKRSKSRPATPATIVPFLAVSLSLALLPACESTSQNAPGGNASLATHYTGSLHSNAVAIGGETTGWILKRKGEPDLDVDVANIRTEAESLAGLLVRIRGRVEQRTYVERGKVPVLVAERIELAN